MKATLLLPLLVVGGLQAAETRVTVRNEGATLSEPGLVTFPAPEKVRGNLVLQGPGGEFRAVQCDASGQASFIAPALEKGERRTYTLVTTLKEPAGAYLAVREGSALRVHVGTDPGHPFFHYQMEPGPLPSGVGDQFLHGAHLHPVYSPSGRLVTGNHPPDHPHQRGIWMSWTKTEFDGRHPDFWNMGKGTDGKLTGEIRFSSLERSWGGPVHGGFISKHLWLDHTSGTTVEVLHETWSVVGYTLDLPGGPAHVIDLVSTQTCAGNEPLKLPKYHYGGLGMRGNALWDPVDEVQMLTSNGDDRKRGDGKKAGWVWLGGEVDGKLTGTAVLTHPENFRSPQPFRLNPKNPQLCVSPSAEGDWSIQPGEPLVLRYRLVIRDGAPDANLLDRLLHDYGKPPKVEVTED